MEARIETLTEKKLIGKHITMSFVENKTFQLWSSFMPQRKEIKNSIDSNLYSLEVFSVGYFNHFDAKNTFQKWAAIEVSDFNEIPSGMEALTIPGGLYAVFVHEGPAIEGDKTYRFIFTEWLPASEYRVDDRPHFAVMSENYQRDNPNSEEIWIPIKKKV
ncbi:GyrI-like domain-containing protein [Flavobacterium hydrophilum]|uniref:GyrI-like domain-containing protein n=1 Tax=Flavobacterium hydrophilum TaxID=2211445 RepID=A0A2V4BWI1_9FLAO|nr:GyrI-like domain-containing protein [Flavobacterium hydrophilum]PXY43378.1 GyrI-like domain-containing protein [Flavobacterium hydrophilum]